MKQNQLVQLVTIKMPYGKFKERLICDLPEFYLSFFFNKGFPNGNIGELMALMYEIKLNGLEYLLKPLRK